MKVAIALLVLCASGMASAQQVVIVPPQPQVHVDPPITFEDLTVGWRHEEVPTNSQMTAYRAMNGFTLRAVGAVPIPDVDLELAASGAWGYDDANNLRGHSQIWVGVRYTARWLGIVRPFAVATPVLDTVQIGSDWRYGVGANGGLGVDVVFPPGMASLDVRGGQVWDIKSNAWSGWQVFATLSIGIHVEPGH